MRVTPRTKALRTCCSRMRPMARTTTRVRGHSGDHAHHLGRHERAPPPGILREPGPLQPAAVCNACPMGKFSGGLGRAHAIIARRANAQFHRHDRRTRMHSLRPKSSPPMRVPTTPPFATHHHGQVQRRVRRELMRRLPGKQMFCFKCSVSQAHLNSDARPAPQACSQAFGPRAPRAQLQALRLARTS
jgi:hypothetical protein